MKNEQDGDKIEEPKSVVVGEMTKDIEELRNKESEGILDLLKDYPGSSFEELAMLSGFCPECFDRRLAWLEKEELVKFDGEYYWRSEEE